MGDVIDFEKARKAKKPNRPWENFPRSSTDEDMLCELHDPAGGPPSIGLLNAPSAEDGEPSAGWTMTPGEARTLGMQLMFWATLCEQGFPHD